MTHEYFYEVECPHATYLNYMDLGNLVSKFYIYVCSYKYTSIWLYNLHYVMSTDYCNHRLYITWPVRYINGF